MGNNLYSNLVNFYNVNDENFKEFMAEIYKEMLTTHRDVQYVKEHLTEEIVKILDKYLVDGKFNVNIEEKVNEFLENNQEIEDINTKLNTNTNNIKNISSQLDTKEKQINDIVTVNITDFGAKTSKSDNKVEFENAVKYLTSKGGGKLLIPLGVFKKSGRLTISCSNIIIEGLGSSSVIQQLDNNICIYCNSEKDVTFKNFKIDGNNFGQLNIGILALEGVNNFLVENVEVCNTPNSVNGISVSQEGSKGTIRDNNVHNCGKAGIYSATGSEFVVIENNIVHDIHNSEYDVPCIQVIGGHNTKVQNNICFNGDNAGIYLLTGGNYDNDLTDVPVKTFISGNTCYGSKNGIYLANARTETNSFRTDTIISNNTIFNNKEGGIIIENRNDISIIGNIVFENNIIKNTLGDGIRIKNSKNITLIGNKVYDNGRSGFKFDGAINITLVGNESTQKYGTQIAHYRFEGVVSDKITATNNIGTWFKSVKPTNMIQALNNDTSDDIHINDSEVLVSNKNIRAKTGTWNGEHLVLGEFHLFIGADGKLYKKNGVPTSDTDGIIVGTEN